MILVMCLVYYTYQQWHYSIMLKDSLITIPLSLLALGTFGCGSLLGFLLFWLSYCSTPLGLHISLTSASLLLLLGCCSPLRWLSLPPSRFLPFFLFLFLLFFLCYRLR